MLQNWGRQAGARTNHLCLDLYDLPQIPHEVAEEIGGAARFVIRESECPYCRAVRVERERGTRFIWEDAASVAFAPFASRSPFEVWIVPRRHEADFGRATDADLASTAEGLRQVLGRLDLLGGPPYNLVLHTAPVAGQVDATYHWHWEIHPRLREIAGLELGTGLPVNSVSPEEAADQLVRRLGRGEDDDRPDPRPGVPAGGREPPAPIPTSPPRGVTRPRRPSSFGRSAGSARAASLAPGGPVLVDLSLRWGVRPVIPGRDIPPPEPDEIPRDAPSTAPTSPRRVRIPADPVAARAFVEGLFARHQRRSTPTWSACCATRSWPRT